jgi:hypothetical protein
MRVLMLILAVLFCLCGIGGSIMGPLNLNIHIYGNNTESQQSYSALLQDLIQQKETAEKSEMSAAVTEELESIDKIINVLPSPFVYTLLHIFYYGILPILAILLLVLAFMKNPNVNKISPMLLIASLLLWGLVPGIEGSTYGPASPKQIALIISILMILHSITSFLSYRFIKKT